MGAKRDFALIKHSHDLGTLLDLDLTGLADNSLLQYNLATLTWEDVTVAGLNGQLDHGTLLGLADNDHPQYALTTTDMIAGAGLTGGGTLAANRTFTVGAGTGITVNADDVALSAATIASLLLADTSVQPARALTAGAGLTGGGDLSANRTFDVGAGTGITVNTDDVQINFGVAAEWTANHGWADNVEIQLGTGNDLRLYHDGTDSYVRTDTGTLRLNVGAVTVARFTDNGTGAVFALQTDASGAAYYATDRDDGQITFLGGLIGGAGNFAAVQLFGGSYTNYAGSLWVDAGNPGTSGTNDGKIFMRTNGAESFRLDRNTTADETKLLLWDISAGAMVRISRGASDSGGAGFRVLRIPN